MDRLHRDDRPEPFIRDRLTFLAYGMTIAFGFTVAMLGPAMPLLRSDLGISRAVGGLHFSSLAFGSVVAGFVIERVIGAWGRHRIFWLGGLGLVTGSLLLATGMHPALTLVGALIVGTSGTATLTVGQATLSDRHASHRATALTEINTAMSFGSVLPALFIGAAVAIGLGWRPVVGVPVAIFITLAVVRRAEAFPPSPSGMADVSQEPRRLPLGYWFYWAALAPSVGAEWSIGAWGAGYLLDVAGTSEAAASLLMTAFFGAMLAGRLVGGRLSRFLPPFSLLLAATSVGLAGVLLFWGSRSAAPIVAGLFVAGLGIAMLFPMLLTLAMNTAPERADAASARTFIAAGGAVLVAPLTLGAIADQIGIRGAFGIVPGLFLLVVLFAALGRRASALPSERSGPPRHALPGRS